MNSIALSELVPLMPELFLALMICVMLLTATFFTSKGYLSYYLAQISLIIAACLTGFAYSLVDNTPVLVFSGTYILDSFAVVLKLFVYLITYVVFLYSRKYNEERHIPATEFYVLALLATLGMLLLISGHNLLTLFLGLELLSLPLYALVALHRSKMRCVEAAMKYFVVGALASAVLLYGFSILFGVTHTLDIGEIAKTISLLGSQYNLMVIFALVFIVAGVAFKLGTVPFHMWVPDVYDGSPTSVTLLISAAPKIATFALFVRLLIEGLPNVFAQWHQLLIVVALLSIALGNVAAIVQANIKRMLAYSSIAHMGYMLLGLACGTAVGKTAAIFYVLTYSLMTLGAFGIVALLSHSSFEANDIEDYAGLNSRNPWLAFMMMLLMFSLAGVPPLVGFIAKLSIFDALIEVHLTWVAAVAVIFSIMGAYYYIRVIKVMYFDQPGEAGLILCPQDSKIAISINGIIVLLLGLFPGLLFHLCQGLI